MSQGKQPQPSGRGELVNNGRQGQVVYGPVLDGQGNLVAGAPQGTRVPPKGGSGTAPPKPPASGTSK